MASQTGATQSKENLGEVEVQKNNNQLPDRANDAVARRAYSLFLAANSVSGQDLMHWLQAESEVLRRIPDIREAGSWYTVNVALPGFSPKQVRVNVDGARALIVAERAPLDHGHGGDGMRLEEAIYLVAHWPSAVDPATASAYLKSGSLVLTAKQAGAKQVKG